MKAKLAKLVERWKRDGRKLAVQGRITEARMLFDCDCDVRALLKTKRARNLPSRGQKP